MRPLLGMCYCLQFIGHQIIFFLFSIPLKGSATPPEVEVQPEGVKPYSGFELCVVSTLRCAVLYAVNCTLYTALFTLHTTHSRLHTIHSRLHTSHCRVGKAIIREVQHLAWGKLPSIVKTRQGSAVGNSPPCADCNTWQNATLCQPIRQKLHKDPPTPCVHSWAS